MYGDDSFEYNQWIVQFKGIIKFAEMVSFILTLLYSLDGEKQKIFMAEIMKYENLFTDLDFMRKVKYRDSLVEDYTSEYFGRDYGDDDPFVYQEEIEEQISELSLEMMSILGRVIKVSKESELNIGNDM